QHGCLERLGVGGGNVLRASRIFQHGVLGPNRRIVKPSGDGMRKRDLACSILQHVRISSLQNARRAAAETGCVLAKRLTAAAGLDSNEFDFLVFEEVVEDANGV